MITSYFHWDYGWTSEVAQAKLWEIKTRLTVRGWHIERPVRKHLSKLHEVMYPDTYDLVYEVWKYNREKFFLILTKTKNVFTLRVQNPKGRIITITQPPFEREHLKYWELVDKHRIYAGRKITIDLTYQR